MFYVAEIYFYTGCLFRASIDVNFSIMKLGRLHEQHGPFQGGAHSDHLAACVVANNDLKDITRRNADVDWRIGRVLRIETVV